jgi:hypothetical protein
VPSCRKTPNRLTLISNYAICSFVPRDPAGIQHQGCRRLLFGTRLILARQRSRLGWLYAGRKQGLGQEEHRSGRNSDFKPRTPRFKPSGLLTKKVLTNTSLIRNRRSGTTRFRLRFSHPEFPQGSRLALSSSSEYEIVSMSSFSSWRRWGWLFLTGFWPRLCGDIYRSPDCDAPGALAAFSI